MRFNCGPTWSERAMMREAAKAERLSNWHLKFIWWPTRIGNRECVWLERVWRRGMLQQWGYGDHWVFDYRTLGSHKGLNP